MHVPCSVQGTYVTDHGTEMRHKDEGIPVIRYANRQLNLSECGLPEQINQLHQTFLIH